MKKTDIIQNSSLFNGLSPDQAEIIAALTIEKSYGKGENVFFEGDEADGFYIIGSGRVKVYKMNLLGKEQILHIFGSGEPIGEVAVFHGKPFPASAEVLEKSKLLYITRRDFVDLITSNPFVSMNMLAMLSLRLRQFALQIENLSLKEVPARLAGYLLLASEENGGAASIDLTISKGQLASLLGTIPETLSRIFSKMGEEGLIEVEGRRITILDRKALAEK